MPCPEQVNVAAVQATFPYGTVKVTAVAGGHQQPNGLFDDDGNECLILVAVAVIAVGW